MKTLIKHMVVLGIVLSTSCREDVKNQEVETKAAVEKIETVENEIDVIVEEVNNKELSLMKL